MLKPKILMATMGLSIGGAETHIVELATKLRADGYDVQVCSNGGEYVDTLEASGVPHFHVPLHVRNLFKMVWSFFVVLRILLRERPDVVHSHARIPSFICSIACALTRIPMVTTAHGKFKVSPMLRFFTRWGKRTLAVSDDLYRYLLDNYNVRLENVSLTVNAINTQSFRPGLDPSRIIDELELPRGARYVVYVSRMDEGACDGARQLIRHARAVAAEFPDVHFVLVGGGDALLSIRDSAHDVNMKAGVKLITVTGARTDVPLFCALADVFVGVSRAALEALACEKPVILAGDAGYLGLFRPEILQSSIDCNFTCRGHDYPNPDILKDELVMALRGWEDIEAIRALGRETVLRHYSLDRMTGDALRVYESVLSRGKRFDFFICGYYGYHNAGDEIILKSIIHNLRQQRPGVRLIILAKSPADINRRYGLPAVKRFSLYGLGYAMKRSRVLLFGGGNLIQDVTSTKSLIYYVYLLRKAQRGGLKTMLYANGIGPLLRPGNMRRVSNALSRADIITLREQKSLGLLTGMGLPRAGKPDISVTADEAFTYPVPPAGSFTGLLRDFDVDAAPFVAVSLRNWPRSDPRFCEKLARLLDHIQAEHGLRVLFVPMQYSTDASICRAIAGLMRAPGHIPDELSIEEIAHVFSRSAMVIGMRLHALILGLACARPCMGVVYDPKVEGFLDSIGIKHFVYCEDIDEAALRGMADGMCARLPDITRELEQASRAQRERARLNAPMALALLDSTPVCRGKGERA